MTTYVVVYFAVALLAPAPAQKQKAADAQADRLKYMQDSVASYEMTSTGDRGETLKLQENKFFLKKRVQRVHESKTE